MQQTTIQETIAQVRRCLEEGNYGKGTLLQFQSTTNQLLKFMKTEGTDKYSTELGIRFLKAQYAYEPTETATHSNSERLRHLQKLSEYQLHGTLVLKRASGYNIPTVFREATARFLAYRRFEGIVEKNMSTISLYLERFFDYLTTQSVTQFFEIEEVHFQGFLKFLIGYSNASKNHMMRTVRQFMAFCFKNGYLSKDLSSYAPHVHYEKRARLPSTYSYDEITKLLSMVDRNNPIGKRNYAILLLIARLGLRAGDASNLKFENINWEENLILLTQHKTGQPLTLPLLEDVGFAIVDYLKFGRPKCDCPNIFVRHRPPTTALLSSGIYNMVSTYMGKAGLLAQNKKHGPHALRHSLASRLLEENVPLPIISEILGHTNTETTASYLSISIDKLRCCALEV